MATHTGQSQLHRRLSAGVFVTLSLFALVGGIAQDGLAQDHATQGKQVRGSGYRPLTGAPFFVLSDASFGSDSPALVRVEAPAYAGLEEYSGVDILVYRVPRPLEFLQAQKNLHRVEIPANFTGEGLANALRYLWFHWNATARSAWQRLFTSAARRTVTATAPELRQHPRMWQPPEAEHNPQFAPLQGFPLVDRFRYPLWEAKPIEPPKGVRLAGSSSDFIRVVPGNVRIPIGKQKPGLYLVEAIIGGHRAATLVFVSDTILLTKISAKELLAWTADRQTGKAVADARVTWTDGVGTLQSGRTGPDGTVQFRRESPERTYLIGEDRAGGVFISENFYYDSEIYNAKIYAVTDRPLYRPGDTVHVKFVGRQFTDARRSVPLKPGTIGVTVLDPNGAPLLTRKVPLAADTGGEMSFLLPPESLAGGYDLRFEYAGNAYGAAFRVAEYVKPHFDINLVPGKAEFRTGEPVTGKLLLTYPDGKPVQGATVQVTLKVQPLTMIEGELRYGVQTAVKIDAEELRVDARGGAFLRLPAAEHPSRYILTLFASDAAAYRVRTTKEILIERGSSLYVLSAPRQFTAPGQDVTFGIRPLGPAGNPPTQWEIVRLEDRERRTGRLDPDRGQWVVSFPRSGSYSLMLRDDHGNLLAAASHWVSGEGLKAAPGSIEIVLDKPAYRPGETARALITFPDEVQEALLTLERDRVEQQALLTRGGPWLNLRRIAPAQWQAEVPVRQEHAPNMTFSVLCALHGEYLFQNKGIRVEQEFVAVEFKPDKELYQPGERVSVDLQSSVRGKPVPAMLVVSVVDEMVYTLQPEIAPDVLSFFYHPRRNNVRTSSSLTFIGYDMAVPSQATPPRRSQSRTAGIKVLERPRRDDTDTALWIPTLRTDDKGKASFSFTMPDALTRWRITVRAMTRTGVVGQQTAHVRSFKPFYLTWTGPTRFRPADAPIVNLVGFNQTQDVAPVDLVASGGGVNLTRRVSLAPGPNHLAIPIAKLQEGDLTVALRRAGGTLDSLSTPVRLLHAGWSSPRALFLPVTGVATPLPLPPDARDIRVAFASSAATHFSRIADDLLEYPWGCVEQTASRIIPLSLAYPALAGAPDRLGDRVAQTLQTHRLRLVYMAGPEAAFGWWGRLMPVDLLMTGYAYYADWHASRTLGIPLPREHWANLLEVYRKHAGSQPLLHRALVLWFAREVGLPVKTMLEGLVAELPEAGSTPAPWPDQTASPLLAQPDSSLAQDLTVVLLAHLATQEGVQPPPVLAGRVPAVRRALRQSGLPMARALLLLTDPSGAASEADAILAGVRHDMPTFDRSLTLAWIHKALGGSLGGPTANVRPEGTWTPSTSPAGTATWRHAGRELPRELQLATAPASPLTAIVRYESSAAEAHRLPVRIERRLYRLTPGAKPLEFEAEPLEQAVRVSSHELYIEEVTLSPEGDRRLRYGLLEVSLPPGADVEPTTWGMAVRLPGAAQPVPMEQARHEMGQASYTVPIHYLDGPVTVRHLVRFSLPGRFTLPPARFFRMYQPEQKAFEGEGKGQRVLEVQ